MRLWREEEEKIRREDRELQFEMFRITLVQGFLNSIFTASIAVIISWILLLISLVFVPEVPVEIAASMLRLAWMGVIGWMILISLFFFSFWYFQIRRVSKLEKHYLPLKEKTRS